MADGTGLSTGARAALLAGGAAVVAVVIGLLWPGRTPDAPVAEVPAVAPAPVAVVPEVSVPAEAERVSVSVATPEPAPEIAALAEDEAEPEGLAEAEQSAALDAVAPEPVLPGFDSYRVEADGAAVVAGRAEPLAVISVLVDGVAVAEAQAGGDGSFAALFTLAPNPQPSLMTLESVLPDGRRLESAQSVALGPIAGPVVVADIAPDPVPETAPERAVEVLPDVPEIAPEAIAAADPLTEGAAETEAEPDAAAESIALAEADPAPATEPASDPKPAPESAPESAPVPPIALLLTEEGATVVQAPVVEAAETGAQAGAVSTVLLEAISYSPTGAVQLSGRGQAGQAVRIYLDNAQVADAGIDATGLWQVTLGDTAPGIYTMRVDQIDGAGKVTARFETPFKRETLEALAALSQPAAPAPATQSAGAPETDTQATPSPAEAAAEAPPAPASPPAAAEPIAPGAATDTAPTLPQPVPVPVAGAADAPAAQLAPPPPVTVTVQPGFTLWGIARENFGAGVMYVQVYEANRDKIRNPDLIYPGQVFAIPQKP